MKRSISLVLACGVVASALAETHKTPTRIEGPEISAPVTLSEILLNRAPRGEILWDQSDFAGANALVDQRFGLGNASDSYMVMDVSTGAGGWNINAITTYFTVGFGTWPLENNANLNIIDRTPGELPPNSYDPDVNATVVDWVVLGDPNDVGAFALRAENLDIQLDEGDYWIGMTPRLRFDLFGQEFHIGAPIIDENTAWRNPRGAFGFGQDWTFAYVVDSSGEWEDTIDGSITIEGTQGSGGCPNEGCENGDLDGNCVVDLQDLSALLAEFGSTYDLEDLSNLLSEFGNDCN